MTLIHPKDMKPWNPPYLEDLLDMPLREVLPIIQQAILSHNNTYEGVRCIKNPMDAWVYQQLIWKRFPDIIIEIGTHKGGSAMFFQHILDRIGEDGFVITIDTTHKFLDPKSREVPGIMFFEGDALDDLIFQRVQALISPGDRVMVIEDSAHTYDNTMKILLKYGQLVSPSDYMIVEDTSVGKTLHPWFGSVIEAEWSTYDALKAVRDFVSMDPTFEIDRSLEAFFITGNPSGFLRKL